MRYIYWIIGSIKFLALAFQIIVIHKCQQNFYDGFQLYSQNMDGFIFKNHSQIKTLALFINLSINPLSVLTNQVKALKWTQLIQLPNFPP